LVTLYDDCVSALLHESTSSSGAADQKTVEPAAPLPPPVRVDLTERVAKYWLRRVNQSTADWYMGVPIGKFPEDLRVYEHLIWISRPTVIIEIGASFGGSALWFRDRLRTAASYGRIESWHVLAIDLDTTASRMCLSASDPDYEQSITLIDGDVLDPTLPDRVAAHVPPGARCMVVEDSGHDYDTTIQALRGFSRFVPVDGFFVVEDGCVDIEEMRFLPTWPRGVIPAITDWLESKEGAVFAQRRDLELYGISCHPYGFLERRAPPPEPC